MIHKIKLSPDDIPLFNNIANRYKNTVIQIAQDNMTISAKSSCLDYSILDYNKEMTLIVYDDSSNSVINQFNRWFV